MLYIVTLTHVHVQCNKYFKMVEKCQNNRTNSSGLFAYPVTISVCGHIVHNIFISSSV